MAKKNPLFISGCWHLCQEFEDSGGFLPDLIAYPLKDEGDKVWKMCWKTSIYLGLVVRCLIWVSPSEGKAPHIAQPYSPVSGTNFLYTRFGEGR